MLVKIEKTAQGYVIESNALADALPDSTFWAELTPLAMPTEPVAGAGDSETPAARLHAILGGQQPQPVDKGEYLRYLADKSL